MPNMLMGLVPTTALSFASALIMVRLTLSCRSFFLMYSHSFLVTSVRGRGLSPMMAANAALGFMAFMKAALGVRFFAGAFLAAAFLAGAPSWRVRPSWPGGLLRRCLLAGAFFAGAFFAVAIWMYSIWSRNIDRFR